MKAKRVLVVGAAGAVGRPLYRVFEPMSTPSSGFIATANSAELLRALGCTSLAVDVFDEGAVMKAVETARPDVIIHQVNLE
jgi:dTDP-4-dehydrorhamnose reductase